MRKRAALVKTYGYLLVFSNQAGIHLVELKFIRIIINYHRNLWFCTVWHRAVLRWLVLTHNLWKMSEILPMHKDHICMITVLRWLLVMVWPCQFYPRDLSMHNAHKVNYPKKKMILFIVCFERKCFCSWEWVWTTWEISQKKIRNYWEEE